MYYSAMNIFLLLSFSAFLGSARNVGNPTEVVQRFDLESYNEEQVKGCYHYNQTLGICFDIQQHSMKFLKTTGENIFVDQDLYPDSFLYQVLDQAFLGLDRSMVYIPYDIPRNPVELLTFLAQKKASLTDQQKTEELQSTKAHYDEAMNELRNTPEIHLLELVQEALMDNTTQLEILKKFHTLCFHLLSAADVQTPTELTSVQRDHHSTKQKRCDDMTSDPDENDCLGLCGSGCKCWKFVCGDCCFNQACYEHDLCCDTEERYLYEYCVRVYKYDFSCSSYAAYPECLSKK